MRLQKVGLDLPGGPAAASLARQAVRELGTLPSERLSDLELLVSELVGNSVRHSGVDADRGIFLQLMAGPKEIRVEVTDGGVGFTPSPTPPALDRTDGRGLFLVDQLADTWGVDSRAGTTVWFILELS